MPPIRCLAVTPALHTAFPAGQAPTTADVTVRLAHLQMGDGLVQPM
jgi:hypothetical protein